MTSSDLLGVHVLSEYVYCQRAGVIASETQDDDTGFTSLGRIRLDYSPRYDIIELRRRYHQLSIYLKYMVLAAAVASSVLIALVQFWSPFWWTGFPFVLAWLIYAVRREVQELVALELGFRKARTASQQIPTEPNAKDHREEVVDWWQMREAGFAVLKPTGNLESQRLGLRGKPWRILQRGDLWIPVFLRRNPGKKLLQKQHRVRITAYCLLLEYNNYESPYGIVLDAGNYTGIAIKSSISNLGTLGDAVVKTFRLISSMQALNVVPQEESENKCTRCPFARRRKHIPGFSETRVNGEPVLPYFLDDYNRHSICGDRFRWRPAAQR